MKHSAYTSYDELPLMLSVAEVAAVLGISRAGAYELAHSDDFSALKIGNRIFDLAHDNMKTYLAVDRSSGVGVVTVKSPRAWTRVRQQQRNVAKRSATVVIVVTVKTGPVKIYAQNYLQAPAE